MQINDTRVKNQHSCSSWCMQMQEVVVNALGVCSCGDILNNQVPFKKGKLNITSFYS